VRSEDAAAAEVTMIVKRSVEIVSVVGALIAAVAFGPACNAFGGSDNSSSDKSGGPATTLSAEATQPSSITTDATNVYWADKGAGTIMTVAKSGGTARTVAKGTDQPDDLYAIDDKVYWLEVRGGCPSHNHLLAQAKDSTGAPTALWANDNNCYGTYRMAAAPGLFFVQQDNAIVQVALMTGMHSGLAANENIISGIAGDGIGVYWTAMGAIKFVPLPPGMPTSTFVGNLKNPTEIAIDSNAVYWVDQGDGAIRKLERGKPNTVPTDLVTGLSTSATAAFKLALDTDTVYWTTRDEGTVKSVPKMGGTPKTIAMNEAGPFAIAVDADGLYWGNLGDHTIRSIKP
jgi:hypothetical protein